MKKIISAILAALLLIACLSGCTGTSPNDAQKTADAQSQSSSDETVYTLKVGNVLAADDPITLGLEKWAASVKEKTDGHVLIEVYPNSTLGDSVEVLEQIIAGSDIGVMADTGMLADYVPDMAIYTAPYIFNSPENARAFVDSDMFKGWNDTLATFGIRDLGCNWYQGARNFLTNTPVEKPEDLSGLRVRTMGTTVAQESMKAFGCIPTSLAWSEVYSGMSSKVIDALEAQNTAIHGASLQEVVKYITKTEHFLLYTALVVSENWYQKLPEEYRNILEQEALTAGDYATDLTKELEQKYYEEFEAAGVTVNEVDKTPFIEAASSVYETMGWTDLKAQIDAAVGQ